MEYDMRQDPWISVLPRLTRDATMTYGTMTFGMRSMCLLPTPLVTLSYILVTHSTPSYSSTISTVVDIATTAAVSCCEVTPTSITMRATALGMLVVLFLVFVLLCLHSTTTTMLALCSSLYEYEHTNHQHALCIRCGPLAVALCVHAVRTDPDPHHL